MSDLTSHWRNLYENKYLGAWSLFDAKLGRYREVRARIDSVSDETVIGEGGRKSRPVQLHLSGRKGPIATPMIVTKTSGKALEIMYGPTPAGWVGKEITLYVRQSKQVAKGTGNVLSIRTGGGGRAEEMPDKPPPEPVVAAEDFEDEGGERQPGED